jgi:hypothetical protein
MDAKAGPSSIHSQKNSKNYDVFVNIEIIKDFNL